ncbi:MAG: glycoside hydrolase family 13 protein, partial [Clostridia bacterium]|nr:glycoside hydrolase family 13 protein [Clostridia bacterium]
FEAHSNHRYNTADYMKIDPQLGNEEDLTKLCQKAGEYGISVILDGVFSHTGDDSIYFNRYGRYNCCGAVNSPDSPYKNWYKFTDYPEKYESWLGILTLPETNENDQSFTEFITGEGGVLQYWLKTGISGWRLDVADELPDEFLDKLRNCVKSYNQNAYILGEVWEDASNKISYGKRRRFLQGKQLDSVMNYPFADAIIEFLRGGNGRNLINTVLDICENYPPQSVASLMNHIGTHDTPRIITRLTHKNAYIGDREWQSKQSLSENEYKKGIELVKLAAVIQYTLPGVPSIYYGDEIGLEGYGDPFCRGSFDWSKTDSDLTKFYRTLGKIRRGSSVFYDGEFLPLKTEDGFLVYERGNECETVLIAVNRTDVDKSYKLPEQYTKTRSKLSGKVSKGILTLPPCSAAIFTGKLTDSK